MNFRRELMHALTVVIPTRNRPTLQLAVDSALQQLRPGDQVVVVDDCGDVPVKMPPSATQARCVRLDAAGGVSAARNAGARHSASELIAFLDDDDCYRTGALEHLRRPFEAANSDCAFTFGRRRHVDRHGRSLGEDDFKPMNVVAKCAAGRHLLSLAKLTSSCGWMFRREAFLELGGFDPELRVSEDRDLIYRLLKTEARIVGLDRLCIDYLRPSGVPGGLSSVDAAAGKLTSEARVVDKHIDWFRQHPTVAAIHLNRTASRQLELGDIAAARSTIKLLLRICPTNLRAWRRRLTW